MCRRCRRGHTHALRVRTPQWRLSLSPLLYCLSVFMALSCVDAALMSMFFTATQVAMHRKAVAIGVRKGDGSFELCPNKQKKINLSQGDQIIVVADFE